MFNLCFIEQIQVAHTWDEAWAVLLCEGIVLALLIGKESQCNDAADKMTRQDNHTSMAPRDTGSGIFKLTT